MRVLEPADVERAEPSDVCLDIVLKWAEKIGQPGTAKVIGGAVILCAVNHRREAVMITVPISKEPARIGRDPRWNLRRLGATVWKLTPSIMDARIHGYVTLVEVPEPPPWETAG